MKNRFLFISMALLAVLAVGVGIFTVGGPFAARLERQDYDLLQDLNRLAARLTCEKPDIVLPETIDEDALAIFCNGKYQNWNAVHRTRPEVPVSFHRLSDTSFKLCAAFHDADRSGIQARLMNGFDPKTGCLSRVMR